MPLTPQWVVGMGSPIRRQVKRQRYSARNKFLYFPLFQLAWSVIFSYTPLFSMFGVGSLVRTSHPSGSRQWSDPVLQEFISGPWQSHCPRKLSVPRRVQGLGSQILWLSLFGVQPFCGSRRGRPSNHSTSKLSMSLRDGDSGQSNLVVLSQPQTKLTVPSQPKNLTQANARLTSRALRRASHGNKPAKACALPP
jgi:hypothetical protein